MKRIICIAVLILSVLCPLTVHAASEHEVDKQQCRYSRFGNSPKSAGDLKGPCRACLEEKNAQAAAENEKRQALARAARDAEEKTLREKVAREEAQRKANEPGTVSLAFPQSAKSTIEPKDSTKPLVDDTAGTVSIWAVAGTVTRDGDADPVYHRFISPVFTVERRVAGEASKELRRIMTEYVNDYIKNNFNWKPINGVASSFVDKKDVNQYSFGYYFYYNADGLKGFRRDEVISSMRNSEDQLKYKVYIMDGVSFKY